MIDTLTYESFYQKNRGKKRRESHQEKRHRCAHVDGAANTLALLPAVTASDLVHIFSLLLPPPFSLSTISGEVAGQVTVVSAGLSLPTSPSPSSFRYYPFLA
ncbi:hypothetical protein VNO78_34326 [Psophocarpus tetragonolobus]|uniref:Uncharacterized protein n=1 Tax=Psophocarpus tetragonolobus TaxID=3891 RepID=A0AAN9RPC2_PSOTE